MRAAGAPASDDAPNSLSSAAGALSSAADAVPSASDGRLFPPRPVLIRGAEFHGLLVTHGEVRIDGRVRGEILGADVLEIGESGEVEASIEADEVVVAGTFRGEIRARCRVELRATARLQGSIETPRLVLEEGSVLDGRCRAGSAPNAALATPEKPSKTGGSSS
jgi:cytoskeletal protein CcmA (bactofilin family)